MKQKDAVYEVVKSIFGESFKEGSNYREIFIDNPQLIDLPIRKIALDRLRDKFISGEVKLGKRLLTQDGEPDSEKINDYLPKILTNWLLKDERLNGGSKYVSTVCRRYYERWKREENINFEIRKVIEKGDDLSNITNKIYNSEKYQSYVKVLADLNAHKGIAYEQVSYLLLRHMVETVSKGSIFRDFFEEVKKAHCKAIDEHWYQKEAEYEEYKKSILIKKKKAS